MGGHVTNMVVGAPQEQKNTRESGQSSLQESVSQTTLSLQDGKKSQMKRNIGKPAARKQSTNPGYNLGYFNLWSSRMTREWVRDEVARRKKEEDENQLCKIEATFGLWQDGR